MRKIKTAGVRGSCKGCVLCQVQDLIHYFREKNGTESAKSCHGTKPAGS